MVVMVSGSAGSCLLFSSCGIISSRISSAFSINFAPSLISLFVPREDAEKVLAVMKRTRYGEGAVIIGEVAEAPKGRVLLKTAIGSTRIVDMLAGEMLPRIC